MVSIGLAQQQKQSAFPDLLQLLRLLGFLCWTSWAVGSTAEVGTAGWLLQ